MKAGKITEKGMVIAMGPVQTVYCRTYQVILDVAARCLPWRQARRVEGPGTVARIPALLRGQAERPLVITSPSHMTTGTIPALLQGLEDLGLEWRIFDKVTPNPTARLAEVLAGVYEREVCDSFIALGGGSVLDAAKAAAALVVRPGRCPEQLAGLLRVRKQIPLFVAVPTTAGSGSETTIATVLTDGAHHKYAIMDPCLVPAYAVLDPVLTLGLPPHITATTGMDALTHAVEAYLCRTNRTSGSIRCAEEAFQLIFHMLERAYRDGEDREARAALLTASYQAGCAFTRAGVGNVHAIAHTLGGRYNTAHGLANAVLLPIVLEDYGSAVHSKLAHLADLVGVGAGTEEARTRALVTALRDMNQRMNIPTGFDFIQDEDIPQMAAWADKEANPFYPVPVLYDQVDFCRVIEKSRL